MKAGRIGFVMGLALALLALPPVVGDALAERSKPGEGPSTTQRTPTQRTTTQRTGGNAHHVARPAAKPAGSHVTAQRTTRSTSPSSTAAARATSSRTASRGSRAQRVSFASTPRYATQAGGLSCVPYVRLVTGMAVSGNAANWWHNADGAYARGHRPLPGSVMVFRATGSMRLGHVAVVERVIGPREIRIHHSNWGGPGIRRGTVMRNVSVIDASDDNDWSVVRVQVGHSAENYGRSYPIYGFILNRPEGGRIRHAGVGDGSGLEEVAEAPRSPHATLHESLSLESLTNRP